MSPIRVLTERTMSRGLEPVVQRLMEGVQETVVRQPGLMSIETLMDIENSHKYVVLTKWRSKKEYESWVNHPTYKEITKKLDEVLDEPVSYRVFNEPHDDVFLL